MDGPQVITMVIEPNVDVVMVVVALRRDVSPRRVRPTTWIRRCEVGAYDRAS
jgi:hypothetical protein